MSSLIRLPGDRSGLVAGALDLCALIVSTSLAFGLNTAVTTRWLWLIPLVALGSHVLAGGYRATLVYRSHIQAISSAVVSSTLSILPIYVLLAGSDTSRLAFLASTWVPLTCIGLLVSRYLLRVVSTSVHTGVYRLVGVDDRMRARLVEALAQRPKFRPESIIDIDVGELAVSEGAEIAPPSHDGTNDGEVIVYGHEAVRSRDAARYLLALKVRGRDVYRDTVLYGQLTGRLPVAQKGEEFRGSLALEQTSTGFHTRVVDVVRNVANIAGGVLLLIVFLVPMLVLAVGVRCGGPGPILFRQERLGKDRKPFELYKFRTMRIDAERNGPQWALKRDDRVTALGGIMRDLHLDELPQIINLCKGELNFVGPRPMRAHFADLLAEEIPDFDVRFLVKPGLTGWAQTLGPYGQNVAEQHEKFEYDLFYVTNRHRLSDLMIVGMTLSKFLRSLSSVVHDRLAGGEQHG